MSEVDRNIAIGHAKEGVAILAHALNACENPKTNYRYGNEEQERFERLIIELVDIVENGRIETTTARNAKNDYSFQKFMGKVLS